MITWMRARPDGQWRDWASEDGQWICAEGMDEYERGRGKPWALLHIHAPHASRTTYIKIDCFATLSAAKRAAEEL